MPEIPVLVEHFPYLGLFILLILGGIGFPFPEDTTLILCGFLISNGVIKPLPAFITVYSGMLLTDYFLFLVGKKYGRAVIKQKRFRKFISPEKISILEEKFNKRGILMIIFGRHLIGLRAQIFLVAGIMRMSSVKFLMADAFSSIFTIAVMAGAGYAGGHSLQVIKKDVTRVEHLVILFVIVLLVIWLLFRYVKLRRDKNIL